jgi:hypothetical protein
MKDENRASERGMSHAKGGRGSESVHDIERVGGKGEGSHSFRMPKEVTDHSCVRTPEKG